MNREIKFRAWDKKNKKFTHWELPKFDGCWDIKFCDVDFNLFTGLKDKNGKECFEGDLIMILDYKNPLEVYFCEDCACFRARLKGYGNNESLDNEFEIIGNIYSNPNLTTPDGEKV